ncbi:hypothetical protein AP3564_02965 [Aeribacillus pallidus]|uniref:Uncharacterized protein n=1 Tax=Aeribacillus pallidus TaxID=33936 RepID=A0A223E293_9BACI|nr:hypothetical protein AP3564_02965 [Aeribacillus pallidus]
MYRTKVLVQLFVIHPEKEGKTFATSGFADGTGGMVIYEANISRPPSFLSIYLWFSTNKNPISPKFGMMGLKRLKKNLYMIGQLF